MTSNQYFQSLLEKKIIPFPAEEEHINEVIDRMTRFMHHNRVHISETIVGGSYGRHTMIRGRGEVDLVYVLSTLGAFEDYKNALQRYTANEFHNNPRKKNQYGCTIDYRRVKADLLITYPFTDPNIFLRTHPSPKQYKPFRIKFQKEFALSRGSIYHNFVRIIKYWRDIGAEKKTWKNCLWLNPTY